LSSWALLLPLRLVKAALPELLVALQEGRLVDATPRPAASALASYSSP
jgi:hypothetical protein